MRKNARFLWSVLVIGFMAAPAWPEESQAPPLPAQAAQPLTPTNTIDSVRSPEWGDGWHWTVGAGAYFFETLGANPAFTTNSFSRGGGTLSGTQQQTNFPQHFDAAPLVFLGFTTADGWGLRARWFEFNDSSSASMTMDGTTSVSTSGARGAGIPSQGSVVSATSDLGFSVVDLEGTYAMALGKTSLMAFAGLCYAHLSQSYQFSVADATNGNSLLTSSHNFNGIGLTLGLDARRPLGDSAFGIYGKARLSALFGPGDQNDFNNQQGNIFTTSRSSHITTSSLLAMFELEVGADWRRPLGRFEIFAQAGFAAQYWIQLNTPGPNAESTIQGYSANTFMFIGGVARVGVSF